MATITSLNASIGLTSEGFTAGVREVIDSVGKMAETFAQGPVMAAAMNLVEGAVSELTSSVNASTGAWGIWGAAIGIGVSYLTDIAARAIQATLAWHGESIAKLASTAATYALATATGVLTAATATLEAVALPIWVGIAAAIAVVAAIAWGLYEIWKKLSTAETVSQTAVEEMERLKKATEDNRKSMGEWFADMQKKADQFNMTAAEKRLDDFKRKFGNLPDAEFQIQDAQKAIDDDESRKNFDKQVEEQYRLEEQLAKEAEREANARSDAAIKAIRAENDEREKAEKTAAAAAAKAIEEHEKAQERAHTNHLARLHQQGESLKASLMTPAEEYEKKINDIMALQRVGAIDSDTATRAADKAQADYLKGFDSKASKIESPKTLLKGSYEDNLLANKERSPLEKQTELQKQILHEAQQQRIGVDKLNDTIKALEALELVQF